jgi:hypothetical protein
MVKRINDIPVFTQAVQESILNLKYLIEVLDDVDNPTITTPIVHTAVEEINLLFLTCTSVLKDTMDRHFESTDIELEELDPTFHPPLHTFSLQDLDEEYTDEDLDDDDIDDDE